MKNTRHRAALLATLLFTLGLSGCARVMQDEVGVRRKFGAIQDKVLEPGLRWYNPFTSRIFTLKTRTMNIEIEPGLPSKEGLTVLSEISILYRVNAKDAPLIMKQTGMSYEAEVILPVFRSAAADVCARFDAKDMHSASRRKIEEGILERMMEVLEPRGFIIEAVLLKSIELPAGLSNAIEDKLQAEQLAQKMEFELQRENAEAQRAIIAAEARRKTQRIQAEAARDAQLIDAEGDKAAALIRAEGIAAANEQINKTATPAVLKFRAIEAYGDLVRSNNAKVILTDGKSVPLVNLTP